MDVPFFIKNGNARAAMAITTTPPVTIVCSGISSHPSVVTMAPP